jgi:hypothetical protein
MDDADSYLLEFRLADPADTSPAEFRYLFDAVDELTRSLVIEQMRSFVEMADISGRGRDEVYTSVLRLAPYLPPPAQVISIRRESPWTVLVGLPVATVIWAMRKLIAPEIVQAWTESQLRENFRRFVRDGLFQGAKTQLEAGAAAKQKYGNLIVDDISEAGRLGPDQPALRVTLRRSEILQIEVKDHALMNEFLSRIGMKPK